MLNGKTILIGITGGIAAYKMCELIRMFKRVGANVRIVCTENALQFVTRLTLQNLSGNEVAVEQFDLESFTPEHISFADEADVMVIAPCSANTLSKIANGYCDNLLTSVACAFTKPLIIAPAMNTGMWENPIIQEHTRVLERANHIILQPENGFLACGTEGSGRLCGLDTIFDAVTNALIAPLTGKKIVITAGGTIEKIDPVRCITNHSSGKMGAALARAARRQGADVVLLDASKHSALELQAAVNAEFDTADCIIMAAAVADYRPKETSAQKIKKGADLCIELVQNPDILTELCAKKRVEQTIVGFCAESENLLKNALDKIRRKGCDFLIANDISRSDIGFGADDNEVYIINSSGEVKKIEKTSKDAIARIILKEIYG
jgi:phosphopantothenoylcysteine decarboxylase/phosphopantothenate--cysteine ligase